MNSERKRQRMEAYIQLAQDWKRSGMTQAEYAKAKGISLEVVKYRIRKVRETDPEKLAISALAEAEFAAVPQELVGSAGRMHEGIPMTDHPVLMIQSDGACLQTTNQIRPQLLKTALEVMLRC